MKNMLDQHHMILQAASRLAPYLASISGILSFLPTVSSSLSFLSSSKSNGASHDHCSAPHGNVLPCGLSSLRS